MAEQQQAEYGCPVCGFTGKSEDEVKDHMVEMANDPAHQAYEMDQDEEEDEAAVNGEKTMNTDEDGDTEDMETPVEDNDEK